MEVGDVDPHGLFPHSRLVRVPGRLKTKARCVHARGCRCFLVKTEKQRPPFLLLKTFKHLGWLQQTLLKSILTVCQVRISALVQLIAVMNILLTWRFDFKMFNILFQTQRCDFLRMGSAERTSGSFHTWLWSGNGMIEAQTPRIMDGWISQWV